jgi:hypothetical protein
MRTTVTLDPDVERLLREAMHARRLSFKDALNQAIRNGLTGVKSAREPRFKTRARALGLRAGIDPARLNQRDGDLEAEALLALTQRLQGATPARASKRK